MSWLPTPDPAESHGKIELETLIVPRSRDLGGFEVKRALPAPDRQMVGPFIFFDQMGPAELLTGKGIDIRPHPHTGLATVTYLYKGAFQHRDSTGANQMVQPGEVNWMVAGRGVTHSERTSDEMRRQPGALYGIQTWVALPDEAEDTAPAFHHHGRDELPVVEDGGNRVRLILGNAWGHRSPVQTFTEMFYADVVLTAGAHLPLPDEHEDRGIYVTEGSIRVAGDVFEAGRMMVFRPGDRISLRAGDQGARLMPLGGATLNGPRYLSWNFVASTPERLEEAKRAWMQGDFDDGRFPLPPGDDQEFIPLPPALAPRD